MHLDRRDVRPASFLCGGIASTAPAVECACALNQKVHLSAKLSRQ